MLDPITREEFDLLLLEMEQLTGIECPEDFASIHWERFKDLPYKIVRAVFMKVIKK